MIFAYTAKDAEGFTVKGNIEAPDARAAVQTLREYKLLPVTIRKRRDQSGILLKIRSLQFGRGTDIVSFTRQLATMIEAGLTISDALSILRRQTRDEVTQEMIEQIIRDIDGGMSLAQAMGKHPRWFNHIYISLIRAGESAGVLDKILGRLASNLEKERDFRNKIRGAMVYPIIVILAMVGVMIVMMVFVVPRLTSLFSELGTSLPVPTRILIGLSTLFTRMWYVLIAGVIGFTFWLRWWGQREVGRKVLDRLKLRIPLWGKIHQDVVLAELTRTLSLLIAAGIPIIAALETVAHASGNVLYQQALISAARQVERGFSLATPIDREPAFPPIVAQMVRTGESTGKLDALLMKVSMYFEREAEYAIHGLTTAIEPAIMIILGLGVAFLVMAVILPIYQLTTAF